MADTTFIPGTVIESSWLNDVNDLVYGIQSDASELTGPGLVPYDGSAIYAFNSVGWRIQVPQKSIMDFVTVDPDTITDWTSIMQEAVDYAETFASTTGLGITFPGGRRYRHGNVVVGASRVQLISDGTARLEKIASTGNGIEFKAPGWPGDDDARIFHVGIEGFIVANYTAAGTVGDNVYFENCSKMHVINCRFENFPFAPWNAFSFRRCINVWVSRGRGDNCTNSGFVFVESGGIFGGDCTSDANDSCGFEFDTCVGIYFENLEAYGNGLHAYKVWDSGTYSSSTIASQSAYFFPSMWIADTSGDHNFSISETRIGVLTACWASDQIQPSGVYPVDKVGFAITTCESLTLQGCLALKNSASGVEVSTDSTNIKVIGGSFVSNGQSSSSTNRNGVTHQGTGVVQGIDAYNDAARYGATQQYGLNITLGAAGNFMRARDNNLTGNAVGGMVPISATNYTNFEESGNDIGVSFDVASASTLALPVCGDTFNVTGTTSITDITPKWRGKKVHLTFASTAAITAGSGMRLPSTSVAPGQYGCASLLYDGARWVMTSNSVNDNT